MNPILRNILAVVAGLFIGAMVNKGIIDNSASVIPLPEGIIPNDFESLKANIHRFRPINYLMPFLAHALGTLVGAMIAAGIAASHKMKLALLIGFLFSIGGVMMVMALPSPFWFDVLDLTVAYIPMALLGAKLVGKN